MSNEDTKVLKMLKALDNPIRRMIVEFILNYKEGDEIRVAHKMRGGLKEDVPAREDGEEC